MNNMDTQINQNKAGARPMNKNKTADEHPAMESDLNEQQENRSNQALNDDKATQGRQDGIEQVRVSGENENQETGVKRYDESDPQWTEPDVQMQQDEVNPELQANIGPQS
jgi:hypothetical protein